MTTKNWKFGPFEYERVGVVALVRIRGVNIYERVGSVYRLFGITWQPNV